MRFVLLSSVVPIVVAGAACGGGGGRNTTPRNDEPHLRPEVTEQRWYRAVSVCGQGPYELEIPVAGARWGEEFELRLHAPHAVEVQAVVLADGTEVERRGGVYTTKGKVDVDPANTRCVADARERLTLGRPGGGTGGGGGAPGTPRTPGVTVVDPPAAPPAKLELDTSLVTSSTPVVRFGWRDGEGRAAAPPRVIRIRFWSISPNDLAGVLFGVARVEWRPNVSDAAYEAHLVAVRERFAAEERRRDDEWRRQQDEAARRAAAEPARRRPAIDWEAERRRRAEAEARAEEERHRRAIAAALIEERRARRKELCARHPEDRGCWGAGGLKVHLDLERRAEERERYCTLNPEDVRCWDTLERARRERVWNRRRQAALAPPQQPDGPPPAALDETIPPKLSLNAEWRPGYWHWSGASWFWIAGMWRVPESDITAEQTTVAPQAPPAPQTEQPPPPPMVAAVWVPGFWQWSGTAWVWIPGSWQLRPEARATWRAPEWRVRGSVHVLIPGGWITGGRR